MNLFVTPMDQAERERRLALLTEAVHDAQQVARALCNSRDGDAEVRLLFSRLETVRLELEQLRRGHGQAPFEEIDPKWTGPLPWRLVTDL